MNKNGSCDQKKSLLISHILQNLFNFIPSLGNTLKVMGKFEEAVICCRRHLEICQEHRDRVGEGRALYNLGNVYHAKV